MASRVVVPESDIVQISNGDWLLVKRRLNHGEYQELLARKYIAESSGVVRVNLHKAGWEKIAIYLLDWSLVNGKGEKLAISGQSPDAIDQALDILDPESVDEIGRAIDTYVAAREAERAASKKILDGATGSSAISPSLSGAAGVMSGSEN